MSTHNTKIRKMNVILLIIMCNPVPGPGTSERLDRGKMLFSLQKPKKEDDKRTKSPRL